MKIIIVGAGQVGGTLAENLVGENNDISVVDIDGEKLRELQDKMDLQVVTGQGSYPDVLKIAGAEDADMVIAVTSDDATNMITCQICSSLFNTPKKIARIRSNQILKYAEQLFHKNHIPIDHIIAPEELVTRDIVRLIDYPGALQVLEFAQGKVSLVAVKAYYGGLLVGHALSTLKDHIPNVDTRVAAIYRNGKPIRPLGTTVIEADDEVFFIAASIHIRAVMNELQKLESAYKRIMIAGGGNIGAGLARILEKNHQVKLIERSAIRAEELTSELNDTLVFAGDSSDQVLLTEENIDQFDIFIAVTNDDEANIMSSLLAKKLGVRKTMVLIQRDAYIDLIHGSTIDIAISPQQATISALLTHVRRGAINNVYSLRGGAAEAIEIVAKGDKKSSKVVGRIIKKIKLPPGATIAAIVRDNEVLIAHSNTVIHEEDHVILFLVNKRYISDIEKLFQVSPIYF
ncbi:Trk system potassium transporter TrkA [Colwellia ponticola]|uniref:Trk system potassium uptake protein TrkA n=1 Tax=Colwellia ponticola TaxID=2304625 RepID=A0A8H2JL58_9GAMM|nr:Trk system potassium transporter TrkA [Colwellia ponticola]TMM45215.1 Trk system potassium transporter TrkA [Colwellia ponticola]